MGSKRRRPFTDLIQELQRNPGGFDFFQAVRILQAERHQSPGSVGGDLAPLREGIRFRSHPTLGYPGTSIRHLVPAQADGQHELVVNFLSLIGVTGALPLHYTEQLLARLQLRDRSLTDFLDLFHHRSVALFFRAWRKYNVPFADEGEPSTLPGKKVPGGVLGVLRSLVGLGTDRLELPEGLPSDSWLFYAGHFARPTRTADGLERMVADACGQRVRIETFIGSWLDLSSSARSRLMPSKQRGGRVALSQRLGMGFVLGSRVWDVQSKVRLHIGPLSSEEYRRWMPMSPASNRLMTLIKSYLGHEVDFDLRIKPAEGPLHYIRLGGADAATDGVDSGSGQELAEQAVRGGLGRDTWLAGSRAYPLPFSAGVTVDNRQDAVREFALFPS